jgi:hypothetical protein
VLKPLYSAAGRSFYLAGSGYASAPNSQQAERLFRRHGQLLFEPWLERVEDFGCVGVVDHQGFRLRGFHRLLVNARGRFQAIELGAKECGLEGLGLPANEKERLLEVVSAVAASLRQAGYLGPFGIDFFRYRRADGAVALHPLVEINARMTMGLLARALVDRLRGPMGFSSEQRLRLASGPAMPTPPPGLEGQVIPLLHPNLDNPTACWLQPVAS